MTQKLQYFPSDLSNILKIGKIHEMTIADVDGVKVLRIVCDDAPEEFVTVRAGKRVSKCLETPARKPDCSEPKTFGDRVLKGAESGIQNWWNNKKKPDWME